MTSSTSRGRWLPAVAIAMIGIVLVMASRSPLAGTQPQAGSPPRPAGPHHTPEADAASPAPTADTPAIDRLLAARWADAGLEPAAPAPELTVLRRAWLALAGTIPSLEEIRRFEADPRPDRLDLAIAALLADRRSAEALARRLAPVLVGEDVGQFIVFRRDRFTTWLADQLHANRPWDRIVHDMVASRGLWTDTPAVNFVTQAAEQGRINADTLAGRACRAFLGQRIDCAQCHDHPFAAWKQPQFEGLAACFAQARLTGVGVEDDRDEPFAGELGVGGGLRSLEGFRDDEDERRGGIETSSGFGKVFGIDVGGETDVRAVGIVVAQRVPHQAGAEVGAADTDVENGLYGEAKAALAGAVGEGGGLLGFAIHGVDSGNAFAAATERPVQGGAVFGCVDDACCEEGPYLVVKPALDGEGLQLLEALTDTGLAQSRAAARRTIEQGGAYVNNRRISDVAYRLTPKDLAGVATLVLRSGKKSYAVARFG